MTLRAWAELVTREVRDRIPDVRAVLKGKTVTWTLGTRTAMLEATRAIWWLRTGGALTYDESKDARSAHVAAGNILTHLDARWCRGIDHAPYSDVEMKRFEVDKPLRRTLGA